MVRVAVLGAGITGVCSAYQIKEKYPNVDVTIIAEKFTPNNTSDGAAGLVRNAQVGKSQLLTCFIQVLAPFNYVQAFVPKIHKSL